MSKAILRRILVAGATGAIFAALAACGDSGDGTNVDEQKSKETTDSKDLDGQKQQQAGPESCGEGCRDFVLDSVGVPLDKTLSDSYSEDMDDDGKVDNRVGSVVSGIAALVPELVDKYDPQALIDHAVNQGLALGLLRMTDPSQGEVGAWFWLAEPQTCCDSEDDPAACAQEAEQKCFSGDAQFDAGLALPYYVSGVVKDGVVRLEAPEMPFRISAFDEVHEVIVRKAVLVAKLEGDRLVDGKLFGVIDFSDIKRTLIRELAALGTNVLSDPNENEEAKKYVTKFVDTDTDGTITEEEVIASPLGPVFEGDIDVNGDNVMDLSVGVGFTAVGANIQL